MNLKYFDAHLHWFINSAFADRLAENIGDRSSGEYYIDTYCKDGTLVGGIIMGNGDIHQQGINIPDNFYYCLGLDLKEQVAQIDDYFDCIEEHLMREKCVGIEIYPGYIPIYPNSGYYDSIYKLLVRYNKVLSVHTGMLASLSGKLKYAHPLHLDDIAIDYPSLRIVMCHFGNPFLSEAAAVLERNKNVYVDLSGLIEGPFDAQKFMIEEKNYIELLKTWIQYIGDNQRFMFGTDWPAVKCDIYTEFISELFPENDIENILINNALNIYNIKGD